MAFKRLWCKNIKFACKNAFCNLKITHMLTFLDLKRNGIANSYLWLFDIIGEEKINESFL